MSINEKLSLKNLGNLSTLLGVFDELAKTQKTFNLDEFVGTAKNFINGMGIDEAINGLRKLGVEGDDLKDVLIKMGFKAGDVGDKLKDIGTSGVKSTGKLGTAFAGLAAKIGISTTALGALTGALAVVGVAFAAFKIYDSYIQRCVDSAKEAGSAWSSFNTSSESQIDRIKELNDALKSGTLTEAESYNAKSELYSIQQSLIDSYGNQAKAIDLVNGKIDQEIEKIRMLNAEQADSFMNKNHTGIEKAISEMAKIRKVDLGVIANSDSADMKAVRDVLSEYRDTIKLTQGIDGTVQTIYFEGNAEDADRVLNELMTDLRDRAKEFGESGVFDSILSGVSDALSDVNGVLENYQQLYEQQKQAALIADKTNYGFGDESKTAAAWIADLESAVNDYNAALSSGDTDKISEAEAAFNNVKNAAMSATDETGKLKLGQYSEQIDDIINRLNTAAIAAYDFNNAISGDKSKLGWDLSGYTDIIKESGLDDIDLLSMIKDGGLEDVRAYFASAAASAKDELEKISEGGSVDLLVRPTIDTSLLLDAGWSEEVAGQAGEVATVFTNTFSNASGNVAINFTPIMADENGNLRGELSPEAFSEYVENVTSGVHGDFLNLQVGVGLEFVNKHGGVLSEEALITYAENVLAGVHDDYLKLQIGAEFTGESAIDEAEEAAERIHNLHDGLFADGFKNQETALIKVMEAAKELGIIEDFTADQMDELANALSNAGLLAKQTAEDTGVATKSYTDMVTSVSSLKSELGAINGAISEQGYSGNLSVDTYNSLIAISKDYAACVEYQNGALQLNAEKANILFEAKSKLQKAEIELQKVTEAAKWKENADEIARLTKEYDGLDPVIKDQIDNLKKENEGIEANLVGYDLQIAAIEELTSAYGRWKAVSESDNSDSMYKDIQKAYEQIKEAQKTGQTGVGNVVYQAAVELLVPDGQDVDKYMSTLKKYIMDGSSGLTNFINDMVTNNLMDRTGSEVKMKMGVTMEQICETMKITPDMAKAIFNALEMYDFDFDWTEEDYNFNIDTSKIDAEIAELEARIAEITSDTTVELKPGESLESLKKSLDEAYEKKQAMLSGDSTTSGENDITYTVNANTEAADNALESIKGKLEEIATKIDEVSKKVIGNLGADKTIGVLSRVHQLLLDINNLKIADKSFNVYENVVSSSSSGTKSGGSSGSIKAQAKADGTRKAKAGLALVGDEYSSDGSPKPELIISDGVAYVAGQHGPEFVNLKSGDQVVPAKETKKILHGNPDARRSLVQAFATGAGGYAAGSAAEQMYLDGKIPATAEWLKQQEEKKKAEAAAKQKAAAQKKKAQTSGTSAYWSSQQSSTSSNKDTSAYWSSVGVSGGGSTSSLKNPGGSGGGGSGGGSGSSSSSGSSTKEKSQFEKDYEYHQHLLAMEKESYEEYIKWLEKAYQEAYNKGEIELEDYRKYMEEVFEGQKELFQDSIEDIEHKIKFLEREPGNEREIITYYNRIIAKIDAEIAAARARGLNDDDDYIQELLEQKWDYADEIADIEEEITENAKDAVDELVDYRVDMLKQEIEDHKDALNDKLDTLKDFYDEQKQMLQDSYDEEKYLEEQNEKRRSVSDIKDELDQLRFDNSAAAEKRKLELQEELKAAEKDLSDFEKDKALQDAMDLLDRQYEQQEKDIQSQIDELDAKLNDPNALFNQALSDIKHNTAELYGEMVAYNNAHGDGNPETIKEMYDSAKESLDQFLKTFGEAYKDILLVNSSSSAVTGYASGTSHATKGVHELFEGGKDEYVYQTKDGHRYKMFSGLGDKVLNASATDFLYKFANNGEAFMTNMIKSLFGNLSPTSLIRSPGTVSVSTGDIVIQGNADSATVSEIRRAQRENVNHILREFVKLNR